jgi:hypothetical protein
MGQQKRGLILFSLPVKIASILIEKSIHPHSTR